MKIRYLFVALILVLLGIFTHLVFADLSTNSVAVVTPAPVLAQPTTSPTQKPTVILTARPTTRPTTKAISRPTSVPISAAKSTAVAALPQGPSAAVQPSPTAGPVAAAPAAEPALPVLPVTLDTLVVASNAMGGEERIAQIYLPGNYDQDPAQRYPVLYVLDGQQLPQIGFAQTLNELVASGEMEPVIVVAVFSTEGDLRREELGAGPNINLFGWGSLSDAFNQFMVNELVPEVDGTYRTLTGPTHTAVMGWSLGGLTSFYLTWQYPDTFGILGAFSPSFWWRTASEPGEELQARVIPALVAASDPRPGLRMWFEAGTRELPYSDVDSNGVIDMIQDVQDVMKLLEEKGYQANTDMIYVEVAGGQHELSTWETVIPNFLHFAFPAG